MNKNLAHFLTMSMAFAPEMLDKDNILKMINEDPDMKYEDPLQSLKRQLSEEWNKPKAQNIKKNHDKREARSYKKIKELQEQIAMSKNIKLLER